MISSSRAAALGVAGEHGAELGHVVALDRARLDRCRELAAVARLLPVVAEDARARELRDRDLGLPGPVGAHQAHVLARPQRALREAATSLAGRDRDDDVGGERLLRGSRATPTPSSAATAARPLARRRPRARRRGRAP